MVIQAHPILALIPELDQDEIDALVTSIREQGQLHPIVRDRHGRVLDGRGRLRACAILGIEPEFKVITDTEPGFYPAAVNLERRSLTKSQKAMIHVKATFAPGPLDHTAAEPASGQALCARAGVSAAVISKARTVSSWAPEMVDGVIAGAVMLNEAYLAARDRKLAAQSREVRLAALREAAPELAESVADGQLTLDVAWAELRRRDEEREAERRRATERLCLLIPGLAALQDEAMFHLYDPALAPAGYEITSEVIAAARRALAEMERAWRERGLA